MVIKVDVTIVNHGGGRQVARYNYVVSGDGRCQSWSALPSQGRTGPLPGD